MRAQRPFYSIIKRVEPSISLSKGKSKFSVNSGDEKDSNRGRKKRN